jgi:hypothetical protein
MAIRFFFLSPSPAVAISPLMTAIARWLPIDDFRTVEKYANSATDLGASNESSMALAVSQVLGIKIEQIILNNCCPSVKADRPARFKLILATMKSRLFLLPIEASNLIACARSDGGLV